MILKQLECTQIVYIYLSSALRRTRPETFAVNFVSKYILIDCELYLVTLQIYYFRTIHQQPRRLI